MHHSFSLTNLDYVPLSLRKSAKAAAKKSPADLKRIATHCLSLESAAPATYLPLVYRNLDPADIPSSTADPETSLAAAKQAILALDILMCVASGGKKSAPIPAIAALEELFPRLWAWLQLIEKQESELFVGISAANRIAIMLGPLGLMTQHGSTIALLRATDDIVPFLGRCMALLAGNPLTDAASRQSLIQIHRILLQFQIPLDSSASFLAPLAEGFPDGKLDLVHLILDAFSASLSIPRDTRNVVLRSLLSLVGATLSAPGFTHIAYELGIVRRTVALLHPLCALGDFDFIETLLTLLAVQLAGGPPNAHTLHHTHLPEAIRAGLFKVLSTLLSSPRFGFVLKKRPDLRTRILALLEDVLPGARMYRSVVRAAGEHMHELPMRIAHLKLEDPELELAWASTALLYKEAIDNLTTYESAEFVFKQTCCNERCKKIKPYTQFRKCADCWTALYCDKQCQRAAWKAGHRESCRRDTRLASLASADLRFMQHVALSFYKQNKLAVLAAQLLFLDGEEDDPSAVHFATFFDFSTSDRDVGPGGVLVRVNRLHLVRTRRVVGGNSVSEPVDETEVDASASTAPQCPDAHCQCHYHCTCTHLPVRYDATSTTDPLHLVIIDTGSGAYYPQRKLALELPLRSKSDAISEGLRALAGELRLAKTRAGNGAVELTMKMLQTEYGDIYRGLVELSKMEVEEFY